LFASGTKALLIGLVFFGDWTAPHFGLIWAAGFYLRAGGEAVGAIIATCQEHDGNPLLEKPGRLYTIRFCSGWEGLDKDDVGTDSLPTYPFNARRIGF
jgi:hypothetical protein